MEGIEIILNFPLFSFFFLFVIKINQQREPFLQLSVPAPEVREATREDGLALKLEALA